MAYLLALSSAALYGAADFLGGLASRRANTLAIVVTSQGVVGRIVPGPHEAHRQDSYLPMRYDTGRPRAII